MALMRLHPISFPVRVFRLQRRSIPLFFSSELRSLHGKSSISTHAVVSQSVAVPPSNSWTKDNEFPITEDAMMGYILGKKKATEVAHAVWKKVVRKGDVVIDATCGNGYDTLAMLKLVSGDDTSTGRVYAMDLQKHALESTSSLLDQSVDANERKLVELFAICHTKMEDLVQNGDTVRLVAFNLGYLPGGNKSVRTKAETTLVALEAAKRLVVPGGLISVVCYLGHPGGKEEFETVQSFAGGLCSDAWACCKLQMVNRPLAPVPVLLYRKLL